MKNIYGLNSEKKNDAFGLPKYVTMGISFNTGKFLWSVDNEVIFGKYGGLEKKKAQFWVIRSGLEMDVIRNIKARLGVMIPIVAKTSDLGNLKDDMPSPKMGGAVGLGIEFKRFIFDVAVYGDAAESYVEEDIRISAVGTATVKF